MKKEEFAKLMAEADKEFEEFKVTITAMSNEQLILYALSGILNISSLENRFSRLTITELSKRSKPTML